MVSSRSRSVNVVCLYDQFNLYGSARMTPLIVTMYAAHVSGKWPPVTESRVLQIYSNLSMGHKCGKNNSNQQL